MNPRVQPPQQAQDQPSTEINLLRPAGVPLEGRANTNHPPRAGYHDRHDASDCRIADEYPQRAQNNRGHSYQELPSSDDEPEYYIGHHNAE